MANYSAFNFRYEDMKDAELRHFVDDVLDMLKLTAYQSIHARSIGKPIKYAKLNCGKKVAKKYSSVGEVLDGWIAKKNPAAIKNFIENSGMRTFAARSNFMLNHMRVLSVTSNKYIGAQINTKSTFSYVNDGLLIKRFGALFGIDGMKELPPVINPPASPVLTLKLMLKRVKCLDETDPEWGGDDEISAGGVTVDDKQNEAKITEFRVGDFNDGDSKSFNPPKVLKEFTLDNTNPSTFMAFLTLAEKDNGGFGDFLQELYEAVKAEINVILTALGAAAGAAIGAAIGGTIGTTIAGPLGTIIGVVAGLILGALVAWLSNLLQDDVFEPAISGITIERNAAFVGPVQQLSYRDFGGTYLMDVYWTAS